MGQALRADSFAILAPPPELTISQWAEQNLRLSAEDSSEPGMYSADRAPYQRGILDAVSDPNTREVVVMSSAQTGKTTIIKAIIGYFIDQDPSPILCIQPTVEMAETFSKDRLAPMVRDTPVLRDKIADPKSRNSGNTVLHKRFPGGHVTMAGANSPASLASRPIRVVLCDEVDRYPASAGSEGDPVSLARKRATTFWNRKILLVSTPTLKGLSRIEQAYEHSDQRKCWVPCPYCEEPQVLSWKNVRWDEDKPETAAIHCMHCGVIWSEGDRLKAIQAGEWHASKPFRGIAGVHLSELYSPWSTPALMAEAFLQAKKGGPELLKTWVNTSLGETWEEEGESVDPVGLITRREEYSENLPILIRTVGVDVQKDRLELEVVDWGDGEESWSAEYIVLPGDTSLPKVWSDLDELMKDIEPHAVAIDSGYQTQLVYDFCASRGRCYAVKGVAGKGIPLVEDARKRAQRLRRRRRSGISSEPVGVDQAKALIYSRLQISTPSPGYCHFPATADYDDEYFAQLTGEKLTTRYVRGRATLAWIAMRPRVEALDCRVYALAAVRLLNPDYEAIKAAKRSKSEVAQLSPGQQIMQERQKLHRQNRNKGGYVQRWRR